MKNRSLFLALTLALSCNFFLSAQSKLTGTPIGSDPESAFIAFDGDKTNRYMTKSGSYSWVGLDLGEPHIISQVRVSIPTDNKAYYQLGIFQGANNPDFSDAIPIAMIKDRDLDIMEVNCSRGFRYVRYVGPANSYCLVSEVEFYGEPGEGDDKHLWQITNLPTVVINTVNGEIPYDKEHDISSTVIIISKDGTEILAKDKTNIRERGNASREYPKKPWRIKFDKKQNVLDAPAKAKKWTLINNYGDKTLMRNMLAFDIARKMEMEWVPFCTPVDVVLNGEYKGCYQLCDQVEVGEGRLEIDEMEKTDTEGDALTGGYFVEIDAYAVDEPVWFRTAHYGLPVTIKSPDDEDIVESQKKYIENYFNMLEPMMKDTDPLTGYRSIFDNRSFIQHMLVNEMAGNTDTYWSTYMYKRRNDPVIYTGPVWDFDLGFNNDFRTYPVPSRSGSGFLWNSGLASSADGMIYFAQRILLKDASTAAEITDVWRKARRNGLSAEWLNNQVDEYASLIEESQKLNFTRWPILSEKVHMNPVAYGSYEKECEAVKNYCNEQIKHLDKVVGYDPENDVSGIDTIEELEQDAEAVYYTVTGIRINEPGEPGIYVVKKGKSSKLIRVH